MIEMDFHIKTRNTVTESCKCVILMWSWKIPLFPPHAVFCFFGGFIMLMMWHDWFWSVAGWLSSSLVNPYVSPPSFFKSLIAGETWLKWRHSCSEDELIKHNHLFCSPSFTVFAWTKDLRKKSIYSCFIHF